MVGQRAARTRHRGADNFDCSATLHGEFTIRRKNHQIGKASTASPCIVVVLGARLLHRGLDIFGSPPVDYSAWLTAPTFTHSSYWGLVCREPDIVDWIYSGAHPSRIGRINCVLFIGHVSQAPRGCMNFLWWRNYFDCARRVDYLG
jgi:hypothetical protein